MAITSSPPRVAVGKVLAGKFRVERVLAEGGMGVVILATHLHLDRLVALKFLRADISSSWDAVTRFMREARAAGQLKSEHVAHVLDVSVTEDGTPYIVMEYLEGQSLCRLLEEHSTLDIGSAAEYAIQVCEGLAEAHSRGIVHRDIKPDNLFLVERSPGWRSIKILDFGISKLTLADAHSVTTGVIMGSPCYMSPEQLTSTTPVDHRTDIWSLGATLHELLTGKTAFDASLTLPELVSAILHRPAAAVRKLRPDVPKELAAVVDKCLAKNRDARFSSAADVATALLRFAPDRARGLVERAASMAPAFPVSKSRVELAVVSVRPAPDSLSPPSVVRRMGQIAVGGASSKPARVHVAQETIPLATSTALGPTSIPRSMLRRTRSIERASWPIKRLAAAAGGACVLLVVLVAATMPANRPTARTVVLAPTAADVPMTLAPEGVELIVRSSPSALVSGMPGGTAGQIVPHAVTDTTVDPQAGSEVEIPHAGVPAGPSAETGALASHEQSPVVPVIRAAVMGASASRGASGTVTRALAPPPVCAIGPTAPASRPAPATTAAAAPSASTAPHVPVQPSSASTAPHVPVQPENRAVTVEGSLEVDPGGGRAPLRPIETKNPYDAL